MLSEKEPNRRAASKMRDLRPLDPFASIKTKLGILVGSASTVCALAVWWGLHTGLATRYTLPLSVVLALIVTQVLARGMTSPLREMTAAAVAMARGDYSRRVRATSNDEVGELATAFNLMAEDLASVDRQRRELVANVSHELRTPVSALRAVLENIVDGVTEPDPATLRTALLQTERLAGLVEQLLDLSRIEGGATSLRLAPVRLQEFLLVCRDEAAMSGRPVTLRRGRSSPRTCGCWATASACTRCSPTWSTTRRGTPPTAARSGCRPTRTSPASSWTWPTRVRASPRRTGPGSSSGSIAAARPRATAAPGSGWRSPAGSSTCTAAPSGSSTPRSAAGSASSSPARRRR